MLISGQDRTGNSACLKNKKQPIYTLLGSFLFEKAEAKKLTKFTQLLPKQALELTSGLIYCFICTLDLLVRTLRFKEYK
jgi:hypothetical protein